MVVYSAVFVLPPSHHHLVSLHVAGVGSDGIWLVFNTTSYGSGGQGAGRGGVGGEGVPVSLYPFAHRCTSAHHKLHMYTT